MFKAEKLVRRLLQKCMVGEGEDWRGAHSEQGQVRASSLSGAGEGDPRVEALSGTTVEEEVVGQLWIPPLSGQRLWPSACSQGDCGKDRCYK